MNFNLAYHRQDRRHWWDTCSETFLFVTLL